MKEAGKVRVRAGKGGVLEEVACAWALEDGNREYSV